MKPYLAILEGRLAVLFQYRAAAFAGLLTQIFWGIVKMMILMAFYKQSTSSQPLSLSQAITFIWIGQALLQLLILDKEIETQVKSGNVAYELVRPLDLYWIWFFRSFGMRFATTLLRSIPLFLVAGIFFKFPLPASWAIGAAFGASLIFSALLSCAITTIVSISLFWTLSGEGIQRLLPHVSILLSGMVIPLPLFPDWMQPFLNVQPLRGIIDIPSRLYTGVIVGPDILFYLGFQLLWTLIFIFGGKVLIKKAVKQFVVQGG